MLSDGTWTYSWERGRRLASMTAGSTTWSYTYNNDGMRIKRTDGTTTYTYFYNGDLLRYVDINGTKLYFVLDASGQPIEVSYVPAGTATTQVYYYVMNLQGDVTAILDTAGNPVVQYTYDAWGNILSVTGSMASTLGMQNPFRYRGYVYDTETGLYYVSSRYYNPQLGRWINADGVVLEVGRDIFDYNMYAYCSSNPLNLTPNDISVGEQSFSTRKSTSHNFYVPQNPILDIRVYYNVPLYNQNGYSLCWAFCQVMVEDYQAGRIRTNDQATERAISISKSIYGDDWNKGGWPTNSRDLFGDTGIISFIDLYSALVKNGPIYAYYGGTDGAHLVVITGVNITKGIVYTNNPWGIAGEQTYRQFLHGFVGMPSDWDMPFGFYIFTQ